MRLVAGHVICACGWHGELGCKTPCPACGRPAIDRLDDDRIEALRAVARDPSHALAPMMRDRLLELRMLRREGPPVAPSDTRRRRPERRRHAITDRGRAVLAVAAAVDQHRQEGTGT